MIYIGGCRGSIRVCIGGKGSLNLSLPLDVVWLPYPNYFDKLGSIGTEG